MFKKRRRRRGLSPEDQRFQIWFIGSVLSEVFDNLRDRSPIHEQVFAAEAEAAQALTQGDTSGVGLLVAALKTPVMGLDPRKDLHFDIEDVERLQQGGDSE